MFESQPGQGTSILFTDGGAVFVRSDTLNKALKYFELVKRAGVH